MIRFITSEKIFLFGDCVLYLQAFKGMDCVDLVAVLPGRDAGLKILRWPASDKRSKIAMERCVEACSTRPISIVVDLRDLEPESS